MSDLVVSRRAVTRALFTSPILTLPGAAKATATPAPLSPSNGMAETIGAFRAAARASELHSHERYDPAWKAWRAAVDRIPHITTKTSMHGFASFDNLTTADRGLVKMARSIMKDADPNNLRDFEIASAELLEAEALRTAEGERLANDFNINALSEESDRLANIRDKALNTVEDFPVTSVPDLIAKIEIIAETEGQIEPEDLLADLRRIAGRA